MKKPIISFIIGIFILGGLAFMAQQWLSPSPTAAPFHAMSVPNDENTIAPTLGTTQTPTNTTTPPAPPLTTTDSPLLPIPNSSVDAGQSMANAFKQGDPRMPPLDTTPKQQEQATEAELADPKLYAQYEARQNIRLYKAFVKAADIEIPRLQQDIAHAKTAGLSPQQLAEGEEKLRRMQQMRDQLASQYPQP